MKKVFEFVITIVLFAAATISLRWLYTLYKGVDRQYTVPCYSMSEEPAEGFFDTVEHIAGGAGLKRTTTFVTGDYVTEYKFADGRYSAVYGAFKGTVEVPVTWLGSWD